MLSMIDFVDHLMPQSAATSNIDISSNDGGNSIDSDLVRTLSSTLDLVSFDDFDLKALQRDGTLRWGSDLSEVYGDSEFVLATWDQSSPWAVGDTILVGDEQVTIAGLLQYDPFSGDGLTGGKITLVTVLNIVNSISMSVSARIKQYGSMRAVGMDGHQLSKMILAEAFTYAFWGCIIGCGVVAPCSSR